jgi:hypothetical protein
VSTLATGVREAAGHLSGPQTADTGLAIDTSPATCAGHQPSGRRSFRKQRTVNPPIAPTRYNFLYSSSRPACGRPPAAAVLGPQVKAEPQCWSGERRSRLSSWPRPALQAV